MSLKSVPVNPRIHEMRKKIDAVLAQYKDISQTEVLAILATMTGMVLALQDRKYPVSYYIDLVNVNIEAGNRNALSQMAHVDGAFKQVEE